MAKTDLTIEIEDAIKTWHPARIGEIKINKFRPEYTALEVPAAHGTNTGGVIDAVRISEYFGDMEYRNVCRLSKWRKDGIRSTGATCLRRFNPLGNLPEYCDETSCRFCSCEKRGSPMILLTCIEVKVTMNDFRSVHGHNFIGNMNYYAVPAELVKKIEPFVPVEIGILAYLHEGMYKGIRTRRPASFLPMTDEQQKWLMLSAFKRFSDEMKCDFDKLILKYKDRL